MADNYIERQYEQYEARKAAWEKSRKTVRKKPAVQQPEHRAVLQNQVKKIVAVHDLSGVGRVSLTAVIPILSTMGFQVCPLPTAVLSTHTQYPEFSFLDLTEVRHLLYRLPRLCATGSDRTVFYPALPPSDRPGCYRSRIGRQRSFIYRHYRGNGTGNATADPSCRHHYS